MHTTVVISFKPISTNLWMITYDNRILGDDRKYSTKDEAREAALRIVMDRPLVNGMREYIYRPGY